MIERTALPFLPLVSHPETSRRRSKLLYNVLLALWFIATIACAAPDAALTDAANYLSDEAAQAAWMASEGSTPAVVWKNGKETALALRCAFENGNLRRAVWDRKVDLDLSRAEGIQFEFRCEDVAPVSSFSFYFKSGDGWYSGAFSPEATKDWKTIAIRKEDARVEGKPAGWDHVSGLRIAAWRGENRNTQFLIRNVRRTGVLGVDTHIVIAAAKLGKEDAAEPFVNNVSSMLGKLGLRHTVVPDDELTADVLTKARLVILPHNPTLPEVAVSALSDYLRNGGRLLAFYSLPSALEKVSGISRGPHTKPARPGQFSSIRPVPGALQGAPSEAKQASWNIIAAQPVPGRSRVLAEWYDAEGKDAGYPAIIASNNTVLMTHVLLEDDRANKERLLLSLVGLANGEFWKTVIEAKRGEMERIGPYHSLDELAKSLTTSGPAATALRAAVESRDAATSALKGERFAEALADTDKATRNAREAYCLAQSSKPGEFRAFWCHSAFGVKGMSWDEAIERLKANGFTAIMPNMLWGGVAYYPSKVLPVAGDVATRGDQMAECVAACRKHGVQIHVWKVNWNLGHDVPAEFVAKLRAEGRLQQSANGTENPWLCPSSPENLKLERDAMLEVARLYPIDGVHFDYIRYPDADHCFCPRCRERFEHATGTPVAEWPRGVQEKGARRAEWVKWCQGNITALVQSLSTEVRKVRPEIQVSAAVFRNWDVDRASVMQDWKLWCERGYVDFVCPMDYTESSTTYDTWVRKQKEWAGPARLVPGIGASSSRTALSADQVVEQIDITRRHQTAGFIIFNYGPREAADLLPMLSLGATKP